MSLHNVHLSDQDLIMAADGELPARRKPDVMAHLNACPGCRDRMRALEGAMAGFVGARSRELNRQVPSTSGARERLEARLADASRTGEAGFAWPRTIRQIAAATGVMVTVLAAVIIIFETAVNAEGPKPKAGLTPGETRPITMGEICSSPQAEVIAVNIPEETRRKVFSEYGISAHADNFEVDYLITPDLGGASSIRNLWPQPYSTRWNARVKDKLEQRLHQLVCEGKVDLATAQHDIAADWIGAYKKYVGAGEPR